LKKDSLTLGVQQGSKLDIITQEVTHLKGLISDLRGHVSEVAKQKSEAEEKLDKVVFQQVQDLKDLLMQANSSSETKSSFPDDQMEDISQQVDLGNTKFNNNGAPTPLPAPAKAKTVRPRSYLSETQLRIAASSLEATMTAEAEFRREISILSSLRFSSQPARRAAIPEAHSKTFAWVYESSFASWLATKDPGVFWITGKPGSGKSTLMKYLTDNHKTFTIAQEVAGSKRVVFASHYFWSPGTEMQKSHQGLLQNLLFEMFRQCPSIIRSAVPQRWNDEVADLPRLGWSLPELSAALKTMGGLEEYPVQFHLFIDGLDEYSGDHYELCQALRDLSRSPSIKLCVSSRPWNVFEEYFGNDPARAIAIHHKTKADIRNFAESRLGGHPSWAKSTLEGVSKEDLLNDIAERAEGVFLWAFLVTNSLMEGITNDDTVSELRKRLNSLPTDLERLFKHILTGIEPMYHADMAAVLRMALIRPLPWEVYHFHDMEDIDTDYALHMPMKIITGEDRDVHLRRTKKRVNARTKGLLELKTIGNTTWSPLVHFIHRTVWDFLSTGEMSKFLLSKSQVGFEPSLSISKSCLAMMKTADFYKGKDPYGNSVTSLVAECAFHAIRVPVKQVAAIDEVLHELESTVIHMSTMPTPMLSYGDHVDPVRFFEDTARQEGADGYLARKISRDWQLVTPSETVAQDMDRRSPRADVEQAKTSWLGIVTGGVESALKLYGGRS
jgi:hypothetical protein